MASRMCLPLLVPPATSVSSRTPWSTELPEKENWPSTSDVRVAGWTVWSTSTEVDPPSCVTTCRAVGERSRPAWKNTDTEYVPGDVEVGGGSMIMETKGGGGGERR